MFFQKTFSKFVLRRKNEILLALLGGYLFIALFDRGGLHYSSVLLLAVLILPFFGLAVYGDAKKGAGIFVWPALVTFCGLFVLSTFFAPVFDYGFADLILFLAGPVVMFLLSRQKFSPKQMQMFAEWLIFLAVLTSFLGLIFFFLEPFNRLAGTFRNFAEVYSFFPNALGNFLVMILPLAVYFSFFAKKRTAIFFMGVSLFLLSAVFLTFSRGTFLVLIFEFVLFLFFALKSGRRKKEVFSWIRRLVFLALAGFLIAAIFSGLRPNYSLDENRFSDKATLNANEGVSSVSERLGFWKASLEIIRDNSFFGTGSESFRFVYPAYQDELLAFSDHPHNLFFKLGVEHGVFVLGAFVVFLILAFSQVLNFLARLKGESKPFGFTLLLAVSGGLVHNLLDYNFNFAANFLTWWILFGLIFSMYPERRSLWVRLKNVFKNTSWSVSLRPRAEQGGSNPVVKAFHHGIASPLGLAMTSIGFVCAGLFLIGVFEGYHNVQFRLGTRAIASGDYAVGLEYLSKAENMIFDRNLYVDRALAYQDLYFENGDADFEEAAKYSLQKAIAINPYDAFVLGLMAELEEDFALKQDYLLRAIRLDSFNRLSFYADLMKLYLEEGRKDELEKWFPFVDRLLTDYLAKLSLNAHLTILTDNPKSALNLCAVLLHLMRGDQFETEYNQRCLDLQEVFLIEVAKFEEAYGVDVDLGLQPGVAFVK